MPYLARGKKGFHELLTDFVTGKGTFEQSDWAWDELFAFVKAAQTPVHNPLRARSGAWRRCVTVTTSRRSASRRPRRTPRVSSIVNSTCAIGRTCSIRRWWTSCKPVLTTSKSS